MRDAIRALPDGTYRAETFIDGYLDSADPSRRDLPIRVALTVAGDEITVDLTGTAPQVSDRPINMPLVGTVDCAIWLTLRSILLDCRGLRQRAAELRPHAADPHRRTARHAGQPDLPGAGDRAVLRRATRLADTVMKALAQAVPAAGQRRHRQSPRHRLFRPQRKPALGAHGDPGGQLRRAVRQGRDGCGRYALRQHAEQPDRGHRIPSAAAGDAIRAAAGAGRCRPLAWRDRNGPRVCRIWRTGRSRWRATAIATGLGACRAGRRAVWPS